MNANTISTSRPLRTLTSFVRATSKAAKKATLLLFSVAVLLAGGAAAVHGQSALDGFDPNANGGVFSIAVQPDGKIVIGGDFTTVSPNGGAAVARNRIARFNPDGTLDTAFNPNASGIVLAIVVQSDGKILAGGVFTSIGGQTRHRIARLDATTGLPDSFNPGAAGSIFDEVRAIAVQPDGKILVGGVFANMGGQPRNRIARLDATTGLADSFDPNANDAVYSIAVQSDGKILAGGAFTSIGGQTRNQIARLDATTGLADSFNPGAAGAVSDAVRAIAVQPDGKILACGVFSSIGGQTRNNIVRLNPDGALDTAFNPNANAILFAIAVQADGKILAGGTFTNIGGQARNQIARLDATTGLADSFNPNPNNGVYSIAVQSSGKILAGGTFTNIGGATRNRIAGLEKDGRLDRTLDISFVGSSVEAIAVEPDGKILIGGAFTSVLGAQRWRGARLNADGTLDNGFNPIANNLVHAIAVQSDGKILIGGDFTTVTPNLGVTVTRNRIARFNPDGTLDMGFDPNANGNVHAIAVQADGKILAGGFFTSIGGQPRSGIARLDPASGLADSFNPNGSGVHSIAVQSDGKILVGGVFINIGGQPRSAIARLDPASGLADSFNPNANQAVHSIAVQPDGKVLAGGLFINIGGQPRNRIARLDATTGAADSFNPIANNVVFTIGVQSDGKILAGGWFTNIGGQPRNYIARLDATTGLADSFNPNANGRVFAIPVQPDGKVLAGGEFSSIGGQTRTLFARLSNNTAALQNLAVTQTAITWTRDGSSAQFTRVTFESSTDSVNYTPLGNGTPAGNNWTLTGLSLPTGQNFYIRARGYYRSGFQNGSESITESVRNAFITAAPLQLATAVSRKAHGGAGEFDINLPLSGEPGVECRSSGGAHTLVFTFTNNVVSGNASVTTGTGNVLGTPSFAGNTMTVNLTGVTDVQKITVTLSGVTDSFAQVLPDTAVSVNMLIGDTSGNKTVNASDIAQTKGQSGLPVTNANFREDVTVSGSINASDIGLVKARSGASVP